MFAWFLQVEDSFDALLLELSHDIKVFDETIAESLRSNHQVAHPLRVQSLDCWVFAIEVVFVFAGLSHAGDSTVQRRLFLEVRSCGLRNRLGIL